MRHLGLQSVYRGSVFGIFTEGVEVFFFRFEGCVRSGVGWEFESCPGSTVVACSVNKGTLATPTPLN